MPRNTTSNRRWKAAGSLGAALHRAAHDPENEGRLPDIDSTSDFHGAVGELVTRLRAKDSYSWIHSTRVRMFANAIARELQLTPEQIADISLGGALHDIGKVDVPGKLLKQGRRLSDEEYLQVMQHTVIGERLLSPVFSDRPAVLSAVRSHHERVDGNGLPDGLEGCNIPLAARVVAVADAFDAMIHPRPYRERALSITSAVAELEKWAGSQFDQDCVQAFAGWYSANLEQQLAS